MNIDAPKVGMKAKIRFLLNYHSKEENLHVGDELEIVGFPIILVRKPNGDLVTVFNHELEEVK